mmetsp:Transcript_56501/g.120005  ORF Transcript_56501/g.120005 Transcript_56501/m.120005 type:complete len:754 (+) Transcript_56501:1863-4124(+)
MNSVTYENSATLEDETLPSQRSGLHAQLNSIQRARHDNCTPEYWLRQCSNRKKMVEKCIEFGIDDHPQEKEALRKKFAGILAAHFQNAAGEREALELVNEVDSEQDNQHAQIAFLCRNIPYWFMKPLKPKDGGALRKGSANEWPIIKSLKKYVYQFSKDKFKISRIKSYGLFARRDVPACSSSPDGIFALLKKQDDGTYAFVSLCVLEIKTRSALGTVDAIYKQAMNGNKWTECSTGTIEFKSSILDPAYRSQICQHATALNLKHVLIVFGLPGGLPLKMVLVSVSLEHRQTLLTMQQLLSERHIPFCYVEGAAQNIPDLGEDYSSVYGYAQTHKTLELWFHVWKAYDIDMQEHGTPPSARRFIDIVTVYWNKCMGYVDTLRKTVRQAVAKYGPDCGPASLYWFILLDYVLYQAYWHYIHGQMEHKVAGFKSFKQFQMERHRNTSYRSYLQKLKRYEEGLKSRTLEHYFPGLHQRIDHIKRGKNVTTNVPTCEISSPSSNDGTSPASSHDNIQFDTDDRAATPSLKKAIFDFMDTHNPLFDKRMKASLNHHPMQSSKKKIDKRKDGDIARAIRGNCILCCMNCDDRLKSPNSLLCKGRRGRSTVDFCSVCKVYLCKECFVTFHADIVPNMPPCMRRKVGVFRARHLRKDGKQSQDNVRSPVRTVRKTRSNTPSSPSRSELIRKEIGECLVQRAAIKPDSLLTTTPKGGLPESPLQATRKIRAKLVRRHPVPRSRQTITHTGKRKEYPESYEEV